MLGVDARPAVAVLAATLLLLWVFAAADYRRRLGHIATALVIGCGIALGWVVTAWGARHAFEPVQPEAGSFVVPVGARSAQRRVGKERVSTRRSRWSPCPYKKNTPTHPPLDIRVPHHSIAKFTDTT